MEKSFFVGLAYIIGGISLFFVGMNFFAVGVGNSVKKRRFILGKFDKLGIFGYYLGGVLTTAVIQSSDATTILAMNLAEDGVLSKSKALALSFGARLGTVVTALFATLGEFSFSCLVVGFILPCALLCPKRHPNVKNALLGFGLFFVGLFLLRSGTTATQDVLGKLFANTGNYVLLFFIGLLFTAVIQSSSATSSLLVILTSAEIIDIRCAFFVYLGATIGTTATPLLASLKMGKSAKFIAGGYSLSSVFTGTVTLLICNFIVDNIFEIITKVPKSFQLILFGTVYSFLSSVVSLILQKPVEYLSQKISFLSIFNKIKKSKNNSIQKG